MNWQKAAIDDLKKYNGQKESLVNIKQRIWALNQQMEAIRSVSTDSTPVQGGCSHMEDNLLNNIVERQRLTCTYRATEKLVQLVDRGLGGLEERDRLILNRFFINPARGSVERLMDELGYERRRIYQFKDDALYKFTVFMYGLVDY